jgi:APA family basic amino acid/polyamine antiporter
MVTGFGWSGHRMMLECRGMEGKPATLSRSIGLFGLVIYGVGDMVGAGIYGTTGVAAGLMGNAVWMAFLGSMVAAMLTGLSYASISSRYPRAAGAAYVVQRAFGVPYVSYLVGLAVVASGLTSIATGSRVFAGVIGPWLGGTSVVLIAMSYLLLLSLINFRGIRESLWVNVVCTCIEVGGLFFVIAVGSRFWGTVDYFETPMGPAGEGLTATLVLSGAVLTFYAFVGFEDLINLSEETKNPRRNMPIGLVVPFRDLADVSKGAPLTQLIDRAAPWVPGWIFTAITLFAVANTGLMNNIMGSRILYGMSRQGLLPAILGRVHPTRRSPHVAIAVLFVVITILILSGDIAALAAATSLLLLTCFLIVNVSLIVLKRRAGELRGGFEIPTVVPALGALVCGGLISSKIVEGVAKNDLRSPMIAGAVLLVITALFLATRPVVREEESAPGEEESP